MNPLAMNLLERDLVPDFLIRRRIRSLLASRLREEDQRDPERQQQRFSEFLRRLVSSPVAIETGAANEQHYEVPTEFYQKVLAREPALAKRFIFITGDTANPEGWKFLESVGVPVIEKPFAPASFEEAVARVMAAAVAGA